MRPREGTWSPWIPSVFLDCLSFPMLYGNVGRSVEITVCGQDLDMNKVKLTAEGLLARIFQHEIDHLNGITFTQRAEENTLRIIKPEELREPETEPESEEAQQSENAAEEISPGTVMVPGDANGLPPLTKILFCFTLMPALNNLIIRSV